MHAIYMSPGVAVEASCQRVPGRLSRCKRGRRARVAAPPVDRAAVRAALGVDKKRERGSLRMAAPCAPGVVHVFDVTHPEDLVACLVETP